MEEFVEVQLDLEDDVIQFLKDESEKRGIDVDTLVNIILRNYIDTHPMCPKCDNNDINIALEGNIFSYHCPTCNYRWISK